MFHKLINFWRSALFGNAWDAQSKSLVEVQKLGSGLEKQVRDILQWPNGKVTYDHINKYKIQVDNAYPNIENPEIIASVTYTKPDTRGHSNENKFQLKVGELALIKYAYPECRVLLIIGGSGDSWLSYVLDAFKFFYDEVLFLWLESDRNKLLEISQNPKTVKRNHKEFWSVLSQEWGKCILAPQDTIPPKGLVRYTIADILRNQNPKVHHPHLIENEVARLCMHMSKINNGKEWDNFLKGNWGAIEMSRNYFNPLEAIVETVLKYANLKFDGGVSRDVPVPSMLHDLGMQETSVSEDFILYSNELKKPVYIQCKASGGGRKQHGKNIQNRTKEQITRGIIYRCNVIDNSIKLNEKNFHWVSILDGDWGVTKSTPLKYIHMLQLAGYDKYFCAKSLLDENFNVKKEDSPLYNYLVHDLKCQRLDE